MAAQVVFELDNVVIVRDAAAGARTHTNAGTVRYPIRGLPELIENWQLTEDERAYARRSSFLTATSD